MNDSLASRRCSYTRDSAARRRSCSQRFASRRVVSSWVTSALRMAIRPPRRVGTHALFTTKSLAGPTQSTRCATVLLDRRLSQRTDREAGSGPAGDPVPVKVGSVSGVAAADRRRNDLFDFGAPHHSGRPQTVFCADACPLRTRPQRPIPSTVGLAQARTTNGVQ